MSLPPFLTLLLLAAIATPAAAETRDARKARILAPATDFSAPEPFEALQGGSGTNRTELGNRAFSQPSAELDFDQRMLFNLGEAVFDRPWVAAPASTRSDDGLGPLFNARACLGCHVNDGRGHPPEPGDRNMVSMLFALSDAHGGPDPAYGHQFQDQAVPGMASEGRLSVSYVAVPFAYPGGTEVALRKPFYATDTALSEGVTLNPRITPPLIGLGLVEAIEDADILANADPDDADGDGISGRVHLLPDGSVGRFGWKATAASIREQSAIAFSRDIGLSTDLFPAPWGDCTEAQPACRNALHGDDDNGPEIEEELLDLVTFFSANLAVPARRNEDTPEVLEGKALFYEARCTACHVPKFATSANAAPEHRNQLIWPYSDYLLHDMGPGLADGTPTGDAGASEWRTPPLWGIGLTRAVNGHTFLLHDGRARSPEEAILWHGGEALAARDAFAAFTAAERAALLHFLESL